MASFGFCCCLCVGVLFKTQVSSLDTKIVYLSSNVQYPRQTSDFILQSLDLLAPRMYFDSFSGGNEPLGMKSYSPHDKGEVLTNLITAVDVRLRTFLSYIRIQFTELGTQQIRTAAFGPHCQLSLLSFGES